MLHIFSSQLLIFLTEINNNDNHSNILKQYTRNFRGSKNNSFQMKNCDISFLLFISAANICFGGPIGPPTDLTM